MRAAGVFAAQWAILAGSGIPHMFWTNNVSPCPTSRISIWRHAFVPHYRGDGKLPWFLVFTVLRRPFENLLDQPI